MKRPAGEARPAADAKPRPPSCSADRRPQVVLEALVALGATAGRITRVSWQRLLLESGLSPRHVTYGLVKLLLAGALRYRLVLARNHRLYVALCTTTRQKTPTCALLHVLTSNVSITSSESIESNNIYINNYRSIRERDIFSNVENGEVGGRVGGSGGEKEEGEEGEKLAALLAAKLGEQDLLHRYRALVRAYPAALLREALRRALAVPPEQIRKSHAALFHAIIKRL